MSRMPFSFLLLCLATLAFAGVAQAAQPARDARAQPSADGRMNGRMNGRANAPAMPDWDHLTPAQRDTLVSVLRNRWNEHPQQRARMLQHAEQWRTMTPDQRREAQRGMKRFQQMPPEERKRARQLFEQSQQMAPEERAALREKLKAMTPEQRREWFRQQRAQAPAATQDTTPKTP